MGAISGGTSGTTSNAASAPTPGVAEHDRHQQGQKRAAQAAAPRGRVQMRAVREPRPRERPFGAVAHLWVPVCDRPPQVRKQLLPQIADGGGLLGVAVKLLLGVLVVTIVVQVRLGIRGELTVDGSCRLAVGRVDRGGNRDGRLAVETALPARRQRHRRARAGLATPHPATRMRRLDVHPSGADPPACRPPPHRRPLDGHPVGERVGRPPHRRQRRVGIRPPRLVGGEHVRPQAEGAEKEGGE